MKELSIEEKAKLYDEALKVANKYEDTHIMFPSIKDEMFPELKESEDERIRKELIEQVVYIIPNDDEVDSEGNILPTYQKRIDKYIAWLEKQGNRVVDEELSKLLNKVICRFINDPNIPYSERDEVSKKIVPYVEHLKKQGEQKSDDKVEPKFKVGDWIVSKLDGKARQISEVHYDEYNNYYVVEGNEYNIEEYDRLHHFWTIQDAKDGDVLSYRNGQWIFILKALENNNSIIEYYTLLSEDGLSIKDAASTVLISSITPATKEQRDTLMKVISDAGYIFDFDKKELNKIEQKQEWSEEDKDAIDQAILALEDLYDDDCPLCRYDGYKLPYDKAAKRLKSLKDRYTWKPSDEQLEAVKRASNGLWTNLIMESLYNDLKKLREE